MKAFGRSLAAVVAAATLFGGCSLASTAYADSTVTVTPNPWYANEFDGWGTSLAWFANATGSLGKESAITTNLGDEASKKKAVEYGKQLREQFYQSIFSPDGLDLNMARYNVGGGNASDVAYGYPFMRQGAAVPGTWKDDLDGSLNVYGNGITTKQADKDKLAAAFDPTDDNQYDFSKAAAQDWWITRGKKGTNGKADITDIEAFSNSAPWFLTESGYATGGYNSGSNNLKDAKKFAQYLAKNVDHLENLGVNVDTVELFNESETNYWGTPGDTAADGLSDAWAGSNGQLVKRYWNKYYTDKNAAATPYSTGLKKPQEGMHVSNAQQQAAIKVLADELNGNTDTIIAATDATNASDFIKSYNAYPQDVRDLIAQYNVHAYSDGGQMQARDVAQADGKKLSMSEVDGSWQSGSYNPYGFDNALGMMSKISSNVTRLQSKDFTFWQVVEDLYNMQMGSNVNPAGENTNWGTVLIDFDCTVAGADGKLYSERRVNNNGGKTDGIAPCTVIANAKYNGVKAITHFIHPGDKVIANTDEDNTMTATNADGKQTVIHSNSSNTDQKFVIDLSKYGEIADNASGDLYLTTETAQADKDKGVDAATPEVFAKTSNVKQAAGSVVIDKAAKTATVTVPARSIASIQLTGVSGFAADASVQSEHTYQLVGKQSGKAIAQITSGDSALSLADPATTAEAAKQQTLKFTQIEQPKDSERPDLKSFVITNADGKVLVSKDGSNAFSDTLTVDQAKSDKTAQWILNTSDGATYQLLNVAAKQNLDVDGSGTAAGTKVGLWQSPSGTAPADNQTWTFRDVTPTGQQAINVQTTIGATPALPKTVTLQYAWGTGNATVDNWSTVDTSKAGTYTATGTATDVYGNKFAVTATVYVGTFTVADPVSATVLAGSDLATAQAALEKATVNLHVKASPAVAADSAKVTWSWDGVADKLAAAKAGDAVAVSGSYADDNTTIALTGTIYLTAAEPENVADANSNLTVTGQQTEYNKGDQWKNLTDGDTSGEAWVTWNSKNDYSTVPTATVNFGSEREVSSLTITYGNKAPVSAKAEYTTDGVTWQQFGDVAAPKAGETVTFKTDGTVKATQVRIVNTVNGDYMNASEIQAFVVPAANAVKNIAAAQGTTFTVNYGEGDTYKKAVDGDTTVKGWSTWAQTASTTDPVATFTFDKAQTITQVKTFFFWDGRASWPKSQKLEYQDENNAWHEIETKTGWKVQASDAGNNSDGTTAADAPTVDFVLAQPVTAKAIRLTNTLQDTHVYINTAEIQVFAQDADKVISPLPASDAALGDLRLDGVTIDGFTADKASYDVELPEGTKANPVLQVFAKDNAAKVSVTGDGANVSKAGGTATITVTSADGSTTKTYTVKFTVKGNGGGSGGNGGSTPTPSPSPEPEPEPGESVDVWRVYNPNSGLHHYTTSKFEYDELVKQGWNGERSSFKAAQRDDDNPNIMPVYRLYNPNDGNHHWTMSVFERDSLVSLGWHDEGVGWYVDKSGSVDVYRLYNPNSGEHVYTTNKAEYDYLGSLGWHQENIAWKGL